MNMDFNFKGRDIINGYDFTTQELCHIMDTAMIYEKRVKSGEAIKDMEGMLVATLFFEPSTRTRLPSAPLSVFLDFSFLHPAAACKVPARLQT